MEQRLVLQNQDGEVVRSFFWSGRDIEVVRRGDNHRLELLSSVDVLSKMKIPFETLGKIDLSQLKMGPYQLKGLGSLSFANENLSIEIDSHREDEEGRFFYLILTAVFVLAGMFMVVLKSAPKSTPKLVAELKQQVVKIVQNRQKVEVAKSTMPSTVEDTSPKPTIKKVSIKRLGALSALGSLQNSKQKSGLNLGAVHTSAGPGLGGTEGSGGIQTNIYAKGIVSAPLGAGGNINGAGGYGTKGKGGGQAGYGNLTLVGSSGASPLPLGSEAVIAKGLDRDQIAAVINRNLGQVRFCYEQGLQSNASLNGRVAVAFTIGGNGLVMDAQVENTTLNAKTVEDCLVLRLKTWKFPLPEGGVNVKVSYPFVLRRAGQG
jgi:hypothetical protein